MLVEVVHQDDAFAELVELLHGHVDHLLGIARLEVERVEIAGEHRDIPGAEIGHHFRRMLQRREAEEWRGRNAAQRPFHGAEAFFDLVLALLFGQLLVGQRRMRPGVRPDGVAGRQNLLQDFRIVGGVLADRERKCRSCIGPPATSTPTGVLTSHGPSSKVSTTSLSRRKSSCLKCSKPNPGPPVVSISTTRAIPSASGLAHAAFAGAGPRRAPERRVLAPPEPPAALPRPWWPRPATRPRPAHPAKSRLPGSMLPLCASCYLMLIMFGRGLLCQRPSLVAPGSS